MQGNPLSSPDQPAFPDPASHCPVCGSDNRCGQPAPGGTGKDCWCMNATIAPEALARIPAKLVGKACLCPRCAAGLPTTQGA